MSNLAESKPTVQVIDNLSNDEYHALPSWSSSQIKDAVDYSHPMAYFKAKHIDKELERKETASMALGTAIHTAWMEPHLFDEEIAVTPECDKRTKEGKAIYARFLANSEGKNVISQNDNAKVQAMCSSLNKNKDALTLLNGSLIEKSIFWTDAETGLELRVRPDIWREKTFVADLKSTQDASLAGFRSSIYKYGYHISAAMYLDAMDQLGQSIEDFIFICVESEAPYLTAVYTLSDEALEIGRKEYRAALNRIAESFQSGRWAGHNDDKIAEISLPQWVLNKEI